MIRFKKLEFINAITYNKLTEVDLENQGAIYIGGMNGSGKSLIFNVLYNILFGYTPLSSKGKRKLIANNNYYASLSFTINNELFTIKQLFNQSKDSDRYDILKDNESLGIAGGIPECERFISKLLPFTAEEFNSFYYLSQDSLHVLAYGKGSERLNYLSNVFGFEIFDHIRIELKTRLDEVDDKLSSAIQAQETVEEISSKISKYPTIELLDARISLYNKYLEKFTYERNFIDKEMANINREISIIDSREIMEEKLARLGDLLKSEIISQKIDKANRLKEFHENVIREWKILEDLLKSYSNYKDYKDYSYDITNLSNKLDTLMVKRGNAVFNNKEFYKRKYLKEEILSLRKELKVPVPEKLEEHYSANSKKLIESKSLLSRLSNDFITLNKLKDDGGKCSRCGQPLDAFHLKEELGRISKEKKGLRKDVEKYETREKFYINQVSILDKIKDKNNLLNNITYTGSLVDTKLLDNKINELKSLIDKVKERDRLKKEISKYSITEEKFKESSKKIKNIRKILDKFVYNYKQSLNRESLLRQINDLPKITYSNHKNLLLKKENRKNLLNYSISEIISDIKEAKTVKEFVLDYKASLEKCTKLVEKIDEIQDYRRLLNACWKAYAPSKMKKDAVSAIASKIAMQLNIFVPMIFDEDIEFLTVSEENSVNIMFRRGNQPPRDVRLLNGGHKKRFLIALIPTLAGMISSEKRSNLIILDEIDANVDISGRESIGEFLIPYLKKKFETVVVISPSYFSESKLVAPIPLDYFDKIWVAEYKNKSSFLSKLS